jgi:hypothetical protein
LQGWEPFRVNPFRINPCGFALHPELREMRKNGETPKIFP